MNRVAILAVLVAVLATAGVCYFAFAPRPTPRVDGSSEAAFTTSLEAVKHSLPKPQHDEFEKAMATLAKASFLSPDGGENGLATLAAMAADRDAPARRMRSNLDGKTAGEVIAMAEGQSKQLAGVHRQWNESAAIATLKNISSAQAQLQASGIIDRNNNGQGEYGWFGEMAGVSDIALPGSKTVRVEPPVLSRTFGNVDAGRVMRSGYYFQMFLPNKDARPVAEVGQTDAGQSEVLWCCYAWPVTCGDSGDRVFFINQSGDVLTTRNATAKYSGTANPPQPLAAYLSSANDMGGMIAANSTGSDGEAWVVAY